MVTKFGYTLHLDDADYHFPHIRPVSASSIAGLLPAGLSLDAVYALCLVGGSIEVWEIQVLPSRGRALRELAAYYTLCRAAHIWTMVATGDGYHNPKDVHVDDPEKYRVKRD